MDHTVGHVVVFVACASWFTRSFFVAGLRNELDVCMDGVNHKHVPGKEDSLYSECIPWKNLSCCTEETTKRLHNNYHYNFDYHHCLNQSGGHNMSAECFKHFTRDLCFYECDPNIGPWLVKVDRKISQERFVNVPLCASDCESWWKACKDQLTCVYNWPLNFEFIKGRNYCPESSTCRRFDLVYKDAKDFCENVWDKSWKVVPDEEKCMKVWFDGSKGNPNREVAEWYIQQQLNAAPVRIHSDIQQLTLMFGFVTFMVSKYTLCYLI